jgi:hypothetical protein
MSGVGISDKQLWLRSRRHSNRKMRGAVRSGVVSLFAAALLLAVAVSATGCSQESGFTANGAEQHPIF